jgi:hypothetical protein
MVLEPGIVDREWAIWNGGRRGSKAWDSFEADHAHMEIVNADEFDRATACSREVLRHPVASKYLRGVTEQTLTWTDPGTGIKCKARVDALQGNRLVELKTAGDIDRHRFAAAATRYGYHCQAAWYQWGLEMNGVELAGDAVMIVAQSEAPHDVLVYALPSEVIAAGWDTCRALLDRLAECRATGHWPGQCTTEELAFQLPAWARTDDDDEVSDLGLTG